MQKIRTALVEAVEPVLGQEVGPTPPGGIEFLDFVSNIHSGLRNGFGFFFVFLIRRLLFVRDDQKDKG